MSLHNLMTFFLALMLIFGTWHYSRRRPLVAVSLSVGIALFVFWAGRHFFLTLLLAGAGLSYWRFARVRGWVNIAGGLLTISWWYISGLPDEIRWRNYPLKKLELRALRQIRGKYRAGVFGEKQMPTTALILLHPDDYKLFQPIIDDVRGELREELKKRSRGFRVLGAPLISIRPDETVRPGWPRVKVTFAAETTFDENAHPVKPTKLYAKPYFVRVDGDSAGEEILADVGLVFGREPIFANVVITDDRFISRDHAHYDLNDTSTSFWVSDSGSTNGTFVNGIPVNGRHPLRHGDELRLGRDVRYEFLAGEGTTVVQQR